MSPEKATVKGALKSASGAVQTVVSSAAVVRVTGVTAVGVRDTGAITTDAGTTDAGTTDARITDAEFAGYTRSC